MQRREVKDNCRGLCLESSLCFSLPSLSAPCSIMYACRGCTCVCVCVCVCVRACNRRPFTVQTIANPSTSPPPTLLMLLFPTIRPLLTTHLAFQCLPRLRCNRLVHQREERQAQRGERGLQPSRALRAGILSLSQQSLACSPHSSTLGSHRKLKDIRPASARHSLLPPLHTFLIFRALSAPFNSPPPFCLTPG